MITVTDQDWDEYSPNIKAIAVEISRQKQTFYSLPTERAKLRIVELFHNLINDYDGEPFTKSEVYRILDEFDIRFHKTFLNRCWYWLSKGDDVIAGARGDKIAQTMRVCIRNIRQSDWKGYKPRTDEWLDFVDNTKLSPFITLNDECESATKRYLNSYKSYPNDFMYVMDLYRELMSKGLIGYRTFNLTLFQLLFGLRVLSYEKGRITIHEYCSMVKKDVYDKDPEHSYRYRNYLEALLSNVNILFYNQDKDIDIRGVGMIVINDLCDIWKKIGYKHPHPLHVLMQQETIDIISPPIVIED